jgi:hypothetical protein
MIERFQPALADERACIGPVPQDRPLAQHTHPTIEYGALG